VTSMPGYISKKTVDGLTVVTVTGELDLATAPALRHQLRRAADASSPDLAVDLSQVTFFDCAIVGVLVRAMNNVQAEGGCLRLRGLTGGPKRLLDLCHLDGVTCVENMEPAGRGTKQPDRSID
jgi:anti-sigma B factor antagonist